MPLLAATQTESRTAAIPSGSSSLSSVSRATAAFADLQGPLFCGGLGQAYGQVVGFAPRPSFSGILPWDSGMLVIHRRRAMRSDPYPFQLVDHSQDTDRDLLLGKAVKVSQRNRWRWR
jgi:hypothetical protein